MTARSATPAPTPYLPWTVAVPFAISGVVHLVRPEVFEPIIPAPLRGHARELVVGSGVAELACAVGLVVPRTRRTAGRASAALLLAVWPANGQMTLDMARRLRERRDVPSALAFLATLARLPIQIPLIRAALRAR